jgi:tetratricopeptide (TPR) repeat protein
VASEESKKFMKKILVGVLLLTIIRQAPAQDKRLIDSLENRLKEYNNGQPEVKARKPSIADSVTANIYSALSKAYWLSDVNKSMHYASEALTLSEKIDFRRGMGNAYNNIGGLQAMSGEYAQALTCFQKSLNIRKEIGDKKDIAAVYINMGNLYSYQNNSVEALKNYFAAQKLCEEINDKTGLSRCISNIASVYIDQGNYPEINPAEKERLFDLALKKSYEALRIRKEINDSAGISVSYNNIGSIYRLQAKYEEALKNYLASLELKKALNDKRGIALVYGNIGSIYTYQRNFDTAYNYHMESIRLFEEIGDKKGISGRYSEIGENFLKQEKYKDATSYYNKAISLAQGISDIETLRNSYNGLFRIDSAQGNYKAALENYMSYLTYRDSMMNADNTRNITQLQMQFDFGKKQLADSLSFLKARQNDEIRLQRQKAFTFSGVIGFIITVILLFFVHNNYQKQRIANRKLKEAQEELIKKEKMAAFGLMASRVSHEIQNPLNFVNNFSELSKEMVGDVFNAHTEEEKKRNAEMLFTNLEKINEHGKRAANIVRQLQEHSIKGTAQEFFENGNET